LVPRVVGLALTLVGEDHVIRVEVAGGRELLVRMPLDALAEVEGVLGAVLRHFPALGQARLDLGRAFLELGQAVVDRMRRGIEGAAGRVGRGIEALGRGFRAIDEGLGLRHGGAQRQRRSEYEKLFQGSFSLWVWKLSAVSVGSGVGRAL